MFCNYYIIKKFVLQLQSIAKTTKATKLFNDFISKGTLSNKALKDILSALDTQTKINIISQGNLTEKQKIGALASAGLSAEELKAAVSAGALSASQTTAAGTTGTLSAAFQGLWATIAANPFIILGAALAAAAFSAHKYNESQKELASSTQDAARTAKEQSASISDYASKYQELHQALLDAEGDSEKIYSIKQQLLSLQTDLNDKFGDEYGKLNLVTDAYRNQTSAIKAYNKEVAQDYLNENRKGIEQAKREMTRKSTYKLSKSLNSDEVEKLQDIISKYSDQGITAVENYSALGHKDGSYTITLIADPESAKKTINQFMSDVESESKSFEDQHLFDNVLDLSSGALAEANQKIAAYGEQYTQSLIYGIANDDILSPLYDKALKSVREYNEAVLKSEDPFDDEAVKAAYTAIQDVDHEIKNSGADWEKYESIISDVFDQADTRAFEFSQRLKNGDFSHGMSYAASKTSTELSAVNNAHDIHNPFVRLVDGAKEYGLNLEDVISILEHLGIVQDEVSANGKDTVHYDSLAKTIEKVNALSAGFESVSKIMASIKEGGNFDFSLLDDKTFKDNFSDLGSAYTDFIDRISNSPNDIAACQDALNNLLSSWINSKDILDNLSESTAKTTVTMLENIGVTNASDVVTSALAKKKAEAAWASEDLTKATAEDIQTLAQEMGVTGDATQAFYSYIMQKIWASSPISVIGDIDALNNVINALGIAGQAWQRYYALKKEMLRTADLIMDGGTIQTPHTAGGQMTTEEYQKYLADESARTQKAAAEALEKSAQVKLSYGPANGKGVSGPDSRKGGGTESPNTGETKAFSSEIDHAAQSVKILQHELSGLEGQLDSQGISYTEQLAIMDQVITKQNQLVSAYGQSLQIYTTQWEEAKLKISDEAVNAITSGDEFAVENFSDEKVYELAKSAQDAYNQMLDEQQKYTDESLKLEKKRIDKYNKMQENLSSRIDAVKSNLSQVQSYIDQLDVLNRQLPVSTYNQMISYSKEEIGLYEKRIRLAQKELKHTSRTSDRYFELKSLIADCSSAIADCEKSQLEWNKAVLEIPIGHLEEANSALDQQIEKQEKVKSGLDQAITGILDLLDEQREAFEKESKDSDEYFDGLIDNLKKENRAIQDQIDALQKKNDETDRTIETEKKLAALEAAKTQKTRKILKNGEWIWDVDTDAINEAQNEYNAQLNENQIADLQEKKEKNDSTISDLEEQKQSASDAIQEKIDHLDDYRSKWESIPDAFEKQQNQDAASGYFQVNIEELRSQLLQRNLELLNQISASYHDVEVNLDELEKTKEKNLELIEIFEGYVKAWQDGTLSISEAKQKIQETVSDNELEIEALDMRITSVSNYRSTWSDTAGSIFHNLEEIEEGEWNSTEHEQEMWGQKLEQANSFQQEFSAVLNSIAADTDSQMAALLNTFANTAAQMEEYARRIKDAIREAARSEENDDSSSNRSPSNSSGHSSSNSSGSSSGGSKPSGPASDPELQKKNRSHHRGIEAGQVGETPGDPALAKALRSIAGAPPAADETVKILRNDEYVLTGEQARTIMANSLYRHVSPGLAFTPANIPAPLSPQQNIQIDHIDITEAQNIPDITRGIKQGIFEQRLKQELYRK